VSASSSNNAGSGGIVVFDDSPLFLAAGNISSITLLPVEAGAGVQFTWNAIAASAMRGGAPATANEASAHTMTLLEGEYVNQVTVRTSGTAAGAFVSGLVFTTTTERSIGNIPATPAEDDKSSVKTVQAPAGTILAALRGAERYDCNAGACTRTLLQLQLVWAKLPPPIVNTP
jgi:hypothetical protein